MAVVAVGHAGGSRWESSQCVTVVAVGHAGGSQWESSRCVTVVGGHSLFLCGGHAEEGDCGICGWESSRCVAVVAVSALQGALLCRGRAEGRGPTEGCMPAGPHASREGEMLVGSLPAGLHAWYIGKEVVILLEGIVAFPLLGKLST